MTQQAAPSFAIQDLRPDGLYPQIRTLVIESAGWVAMNWLQIVLALLAGMVVFALLHAVRGWALHLCKRGDGVETWPSILGRAIARTGHFFILAASARLVIGYADAPSAIHATIVFLFTIAAVFQAAIWARELIFGAVEHRTQADADRRAALASAFGIIRLLVTISVFAIAIIVVLGNLGVNVTGLVAGLGVGGIAIGLAAQGIFADLFAALAIIFDRPFQLGDSISYDKGTSSGKVEAIGLKSTRIRGDNGEERIVANRKLLDSEILNTTRRARNRFKFNFNIGYAVDPELVEQLPALLRKLIEQEGYVLVHGGVNAFADSGLSYDVEFESVKADFPPDARDKVAAAVLALFRDRDISFAYPTTLNLIAEKTKPAPPARARAGSARSRH